MRNNNCSTIAVARRRRNGKNYKSATVAIVTVASSSRGPIPSHLLTNSHKRAVITIKSSFLQPKRNKEIDRYCWKWGEKSLRLGNCTSKKKKKDEDGMEWKKIVTAAEWKKKRCTTDDATRRERRQAHEFYALSSIARRSGGVCVRADQHIRERVARLEKRVSKHCQLWVCAPNEKRASGARKMEADRWVDTATEAEQKPIKEEEPQMGIPLHMCTVSMWVLL